MKKILFLTNMYPSKIAPSYGIFVEKTYQWLCELYEIKLIKICKSTSIKRKIFDYIKFYVNTIIQGVFFHYDCVYAHYISHSALPISIIRFFRRNIIIIGNIHGEDVFSEYEKYQKNRKRASLFLKYCDYIIAPSEYFKDKLNKEYGFEKSKIFVSPSGGVNTEWFRPKEMNKCKEKVNLDVTKRYIGMVSRIEEGKGWDVFIKAAAMIKRNDVEFVIVGSGSQEEDSKNMIHELGVQNKVTFFPLAGHDKLPDIYNSFDGFCFPTRRISESLGLVGLEAMSCGVPCIISMIAGPSSYCDTENCLRFEAENIVQLSDRMIELLDMDSENLAKIRRNARKTALRYDSELVKQDFLNFFNLNYL